MSLMNINSARCYASLKISWGFALPTTNTQKRKTNIILVRKTLVPVPGIDLKHYITFSTIFSRYYGTRKQVCLVYIYRQNKVYEKTASRATQISFNIQGENATDVVKLFINISFGCGLVNIHLTASFSCMRMVYDFVRFQDVTCFFLTISLLQFR